MSEIPCGIGENGKKRESEFGRGAARFAKRSSSVECEGLESETVISDEQDCCQNVIESTALITVPKNDRRPHLNVIINGHSMIGLLDSGANITILGKGAENIIKTLDANSENQHLIIRTADGSEHKTSAVVSVPFTVGNETKNVRTLIIPTITTQLILGTDFWDAFNIRPIICCAIKDDEDEQPKFDPVNVKHELTEEQQCLLKEVIQTFDRAEKDGILGYTNRTVHTIETGDAPPIKQRQYVVSPYVQNGIAEEINRMLERGIIKRVDNPTWLNPVIAVRKPNGKIRLCIDARKLNDKTVKNAYPQPNANRILGLLKGTKFLSAIDLSEAFFQIPLDEDSQRKTAFAVTGVGAFMFQRMAMGLCNAAASISELVQNVFGCELEPWAFHYTDDFIIATDTFEEHLRILKRVAEKLREAKLLINTEKSRFCMRRIVFLGYVIDENGIQPDPERIQPILDYPRPKTVREVRRLMGMAGWYRRFISNFSSITAPISELIRKSKEKMIWSDEAEEAFQQLKTALISTPILATPDFSKPFQIESDASDLGIGAVLTQNHDGDEKVIAYMSKKLTSTQRKYHVTERECLAVITAIEKFRQYIEGAKFTVITDHASLQWLQNFKDTNGRISRWSLRLQAHDFVIKHRKGSQMIVPDALSRAVEGIQITSLANTSDNEYITLRAAIKNSPGNYFDLRVDCDVILKHVNKYADAIDDAWRIYVPSDHRESVLRQNHVDKLAAHGGFAKTLYRIRRRYYWPTMQQDIARFVKICEVCKATKPTNQCQTAPMGNYRDPERPFKMISIDFCGPYTRTKSGNRSLLVVVDSFSKFALLKSMRTASAGATVEFLECEVFYKYGVPAILISGNGPQLKSTIFNEFLIKHNVTHWKTPRYHAQPNATEAANKTIGNAVRAYLHDEKSQRSWDVNLPELACALNSARHSTTKYPPYTILYGYDMCTSGIDYVAVEPTAERSKTMETIRRRVAENLRAAYERNKIRYDRDRKVRKIEYQPNQIVWKRNTQLSNFSDGYCSKLGDRFIKCKIAKKVGTNAYMLKDLNGREIGVHSTEHLRT